jgi:hypothetical protein
MQTVKWGIDPNPRCGLEWVEPPIVKLARLWYDKGRRLKEAQELPPHQAAMPGAGGGTGGDGNVV